MVKSTIFECEMKDKKKILFIYTNFSSFVKTDWEILSKKYQVTKYQFRPVKGLVKTAIQFIRQFFFLLFQFWKFDAVFVWFADYHSFMPVLFAKLTGKKSFVVVGGYDICRIKSLNYGVFISRFRGFFAYQSMKLCSCNLTVSNYVDRKVKWVVPNSKRKLIYNSVRLENTKSPIQKQDLILTVGQIDNKQTFYRKGIDTFIEIAKRLPNYKFLIVGIDLSLINNLEIDLPTNIKTCKKVPQQELKKYYSEAKIYAQFSRMDTFCLTLAEAMLFECFPVISNEGGMPEVVGNTGLILKRNTDLIAREISKKIENFDALDTGQIKSRILIKFSIEQRKKEILKQAHVNTI